MSWEIEYTDEFEAALVLMGGAKTGDARWYEKAVPDADSLYDRHLDALKREEGPHD